MIKIGICAGRHEMPVDYYVFSGDINPLNVELLEETAHESLLSIYTIVKKTSTEMSFDVELYVTGLTVAVLATLKEMERFVNWKLFKTVTMMHFDKNSGEYYPQSWRE